MVYNYAIQNFNAETMARGVALNQRGVSRKNAIEIVNFIKGKPVAKAIECLEQVVLVKKAIPYKRFNHGVGHRKGHMGSGRYPVKASTAILKLIRSVASNATDKNLNSEALIVKHACVQQGTNSMHHGRQRGRKVKQCHFEIVLFRNICNQP